MNNPPPENTFEAGWEWAVKCLATPSSWFFRGIDEMPDWFLEESCYLRSIPYPGYGTPMPQDEFERGALTAWRLITGNPL